MNYYEIGQRIRRFRKACNMSQEELSEIVGISTTHMSHIETGNTKLSLPVFVDIANALSVQTDELLHDKLGSSKSDMKEKVEEVFDSCTLKEAYILLDIMKSAKVSLDKYKD